MENASENCRCPRWNELPGLALYLDQVLIVLEEALTPFVPGDERVVTPTIINNYVKMKVLPPTDRKKYDRAHIADLIMVLLLKRVLTTAELVLVLRELKDGREPQAAYDLFCTELEQRLTETEHSAAPREGDGCPPLTEAALKALAGKLLFERLAFELHQREEAERREAERLEAERREAERHPAGKKQAREAE